MEKCWFKLRQPDFTPEDENAMGTGRETSPLCLGHFISSLKKLDFVLNKGEIEEFPVNMPVFSTETLHFKWHDANTNTTGGGLGAGAPIAALAGLVLKASIKTIFKKNIENWEEYERLDTYIFQPDRSYVEDCLEGKKLATEVKVLENVVIEEENKTENSGKEEGEVARNNKLAKEIGGKKAWSMFLITGIKVARKGKKTTAESNKTIIKGDIKVDVPTAASGDGNVDYSRSHLQKFGGKGQSDFIWAIRLAKIHKGLLMRDWSLDTYKTRATFGTDDEIVDIYRTVASEGLEHFSITEDEEVGEAIVEDDEDEQHERQVETAHKEDALVHEVEKLMVAEAEEPESASQEPVSDA